LIYFTWIAINNKGEQTMKKTEYVGVRVTEDVYNYFKALAEENQSSISSEIRKVLYHYVRDLNEEAA
jgi:hypothetical protein